MSGEPERKKKQRRCVSCGKSADKSQLFRIVHTKDGAIFFDKQGRAAGRGAYVCSPACLEQARNAKRLDKALRTSLTAGDYERIEQEILGRSAMEKEE